MTTNSGTFKPKLWVPGDWNAFFGLGTNVLLNVLVLSSLMLFVVQLPADTVFGRILPALAIILGSIGSDDRLDYTMIGSTVNHCARLCSIAGPRETLLAASTYQLVKGLVAAEPLEPVRIKGFSEPVSIFRMVARE